MKHILNVDYSFQDKTFLKSVRDNKKEGINYDKDNDPEV